MFDLFSGGLTGSLHLLRAGIPDGIDSLGFFALFKDFLDGEITEYSRNLLRRVGTLVAVGVTPLVTLWIFYQGFLRVTGQSHGSMAALKVEATKIVLIVMICGAAANFQASIYKSLTDGVSQVINYAITGDDKTTVYDDIDEALALMQLAISSIDMLDVGDNPVALKKRDQASLIAGLGVGGPAVVGGCLLILNKFVIAMLLGVGPFFVLCLIFKQTEGLFKGWLNSLLGSLMAMAFLSVAVTLAMDITLALAGGFWAAEGLSRLLGMGTASEGINGVVQMQGILGLVLTTLIMGAPPAAAMLFRGLLANFNPYSTIAGPIGGSGGGSSASPPAGSSHYPGPGVGSAPPPRAHHGTVQDSEGFNPNKIRPA
ncbi:MULTISPECIES: type IV secretion system protein [unclassified Lysobacter]|uniref:type IV secretion system protein n=1 Tax=unclassified Lysobacter TaxID=2635362 RepID=UPI001BEC21EE|nr:MULTISPECIES: type IV secretion system protein [unclassified Lysobacter]MBT2748312.1 type IV secretion system protein [Lysobacter sp. ISL-42]MBT2749921.1 type IV secretion system protein [Lysobacter sp. ISL-50]MBT2781249.1 type IV secretion system protein [Lysobacter sp. ISL-52]